MQRKVLELKGLRVYRETDRTSLIDGIDIELNEGESLGIVGESGSGKTLTLKSIIGLVPEGIRSEAEKNVSCDSIAMIFQDPKKALDPLMPAAHQLLEVYRAHHGDKNDEALRWIKDTLKRLMLPEEILTEKRLPGELSGGQCQRIVTAMALACEPRLLLCDEPTSSLDVTAQKETLRLIKGLQAEHGFAMIFVTHNLAAAASVCDRLMVIRDGKMTESGSAEDILRTPKAEYTKMLVSSILSLPKSGSHKIIQD